MKLTLNISPCPNDTFMFEALLNHRIDTEGLEFELNFDDIEQLNERVIGNQTDISKISYAILPQIVGRYKVLDSGSALGRGNGPLLVSRNANVLCEHSSENNLRSLRIAVPGEHTTANLLMSNIFPSITEKHFMLFSDIADAVATGRYDAGVLIHEGRFTYADKGLQLVADLGHEWERTSGLPLPLGAIVVSSDLPTEVTQRFDRVLRRSVEYAISNPSISRTFVKAHAQELEDKVVDNHIAMFVNQYSISLSSEGRAAVVELTGVTDQSIFA